MWSDHTGCGRVVVGGREGVSLVGGGLCLIQMLTIRRFHPAIRVSISSIPQFRSDSRSSFEVSMELRGDLILPRKIENWRKISLMHILVEKKAASWYVISFSVEKEKAGAPKTRENFNSLELLRRISSLKMCWCGWTEEGCPLWQMWAILAEWGRSLFTYKDFIWIWTMESPDCFHSYWTQIYSKISSNGCWDQYLAQI